MEKDEKLKLIYESANQRHRYFLDWRYRLFAGYILIISAIGYFILTWIQKPENYSEVDYVLVCICGIIMTILFFFINQRITEILWRCQNIAYLIERDLGFNRKNDLGLYGVLLDTKIKNQLDDGKIIELGKKKIIKLGLWDHSGIINWFFII
jgi:hypothetical protein